jgi:hypothetical protein
MKLNKIKILAIITAISMATALQAREIRGVKPSNNNYQSGYNKTSAGCAQPSAKVNLDVNNVRTMILNGGDMWWDLSSAKYEIPKVPDNNLTQRHLNSIFAGSLWIGGLDGSNNLKIAANTYRQNGVDFFAGPIDTFASVSANRCVEFDKIWKITRNDIADFLDPNKQIVTADMQSWPGNHPDFGAGTTSHFLAPYINVGGSLDYEPGTDYPDILGDQALWWVYNDKGNVHTETKALPIGLELHEMAFAFTTNDEINNMTFYKTEIINRGSDYLDKCYFGEWVDPDLGNYADDYVGCDVNRSLGICYNGDDDDDGILGYGLNPPSVGVDFFKGPKDENGNTLGMGKFMYYNNDFQPYGNPENSQHYYNYLKGIWKNNLSMTYGGDGHSGTDTCSYMFPGTTDPKGRANWTEKTAGNQPGDRRFLQSAGPFKLMPGARNEVTVGVVWARASSGGATGSLELLKLADDKAQKLFNNNFAITDGPSSPDYTVQELDQQLIINISGDTIGSKFPSQKIEKYSAIVKGATGNDIIYKFQGYQIYQIKDATVTSGDLSNPDKARLIYEVDLKDNVDRLVNRVFDATVSDFVKVLKVDGENKGIRHSFQVTSDAFATGNNALVNYKTYDFMIISYSNATNDQNDPDQYLAGRLNNKVTTASPHKVWSVNNGIDNDAIAKYGDGPLMKRLEGRGNGGNSLELTQETIDEILSKGSSEFPVYKGGSTPIKIKVIDPLKVPNDKFEIFLIGPYSQMNKVKGDSLGLKTRWKIVRESNGDTVNSDADISIGAEQIISKWGLSVSIKQASNPGSWFYSIDESINNGFIEASYNWADINQQWLSGLPDVDINYVGILNWIRSGKIGENTIKSTNPAGMNFDPYIHDYYTDFNGVPDMVDPQEVYEKALNRSFAPYRLCAYAGYSPSKGNTFGPALNNATATSSNRMENLSSIDLVFTPDKSKWTHSVVLEEAEDSLDAIGRATKLSPRRSLSVDNNGVADGSGTKGKGWFPGYAINIETGQRLNIAFGEDSHLPGENGADMIWNPTSNLFSATDPYPLIGGKHYIYIFTDDSVGIGSSGFKFGPYDQCQNILNSLNSTLVNEHVKVFRSCMYVMMPYLSQLSNLKSVKDGIVPNEVRIRYRVTKPYQRYRTSITSNNTSPHYEFDTKNIATQFSKAAAVKGVEKINVVPNPYYGYSPAHDYEGDQISTNVKFTNLPQKCTIRIYTLNGNLVRTIKKDDNLVEARWDLNNNSNVPIASGMYIIHIDCGDLGVKVLKWMGVMRPVDLNSF